MKFISLAGGLASSAPKTAFIVREEPGTQIKHQIEIPMRDIVARKSPDVPLLAHDIVYVPVSGGHTALVSMQTILGMAAGSAIIANVAR